MIHLMLCGKFNNKQRFLVEHNLYFHMIDYQFFDYPSYMYVAISSVNQDSGSGSGGTVLRQVSKSSNIAAYLNW